MYDCANKIGNEGDLIKHFALTIAIREQATGKKSFSYLDVHAGRSRHDLPAAGEWEKGIGQYAEYCRNEHPLTEDLRYFCKVQSVAKIPQARRYWGSSRIIHDVLQGF